MFRWQFWDEREINAALRRGLLEISPHFRLQKNMTLKNIKAKIRTFGKPLEQCQSWNLYHSVFHGV
jgi:hypothetical protein